ncbi:MAG: hypothetical protein Q8L14_11825 [Myxococcales bacterium]|nr:hypothetical protein [Myxococcales bacterium]
MRAVALVVSVFLSAAASAQQAPPCTKELVGILFDFGTPQAPRLFKCDGRTWAMWTPPASLCTTPPAAQTPSPPPGPPLVPLAADEALVPPPPPASLPPLPTGPKAGTDVVANADCRKACTVAFTQCVRSRCGTSLAASCKQSCDKQQTRCATACP